MSEQLTLGEVLKVARYLKKQGLSQKEINDFPIYIGNDDELNGIHTAWYVQPISPNEPDDQYYEKMINQDRFNIELTRDSILIS
jgi:hypothetical protein